MSETVAMTVVYKEADGYKVEVEMVDELPKVLETSREEIAERLSESAIRAFALNEAEKEVRASGNNRTSVGYSKVYAANWDAVFGKKDASELPN